LKRFDHQPIRHRDDAEIASCGVGRTPAHGAAETGRIAFAANQAGQERALAASPIVYIQVRAFQEHPVREHECPGVAGAGSKDEGGLHVDAVVEGELNGSGILRVLGIAESQEALHLGLNRFLGRKGRQSVQDRCDAGGVAPESDGPPASGGGRRHPEVETLGEPIQSGCQSFRADENHGSHEWSLSLI
jgi:hypothetical protein